MSRREYSASELRKRLVSGSTWARRRGGRAAGPVARAADTQEAAAQSAVVQSAVVDGVAGAPQPVQSLPAQSVLEQSGPASFSPGQSTTAQSELAVLQPEAPRAPTAEELDQVIDQLQGLDLQSDYRFAESLVRRRGTRQGVSQLRRLLQNHQIDPDICAELLAPLSQSEFDRAREVWAQRFDRHAGAQGPVSLRERSRQARFLINRGFSADVVSRVLRAAGGRSSD